MYVITYMHCSLVCATAQQITNRPGTTKTRVLSHVSPCEILGAQARKGQVFSSSILGVCCQEHPINAPYPSSSTCYSYDKEKCAKPGKLQKSNSLSEIGEHWIERYFQFLPSNIQTVPFQLM